MDYSRTTAGLHTLGWFTLVQMATATTMKTAMKLTSQQKPSEYIACIGAHKDRGAR